MKVKSLEEIQESFRFLKQQDGEIARNVENFLARLRKYAAGNWHFKHRFDFFANLELKDYNLALESAGRSSMTYKDMRRLYESYAMDSKE